MKRLMSCLILLALLMTCMISLSSCGYTEWFPTEGAWYCDELQMQLGFDSSCENFFVKDGEKVQCAWGGDRGSRTLGISVVEPITKAYWVGKELLFVKQVDLTETQLVVQSSTQIHRALGNTGSGTACKACRMAP